MGRTRARPLPGIVDVDVGPAVLNQALGHDGPGGGEDLLLVDVDAQQFQLFQPIAGVREIFSPTSMRHGSVAVPRAFVARSVT